MGEKTTEKPEKEVKVKPKKASRKNQRIFDNKTIIIIKIAAACVLFFCCCFFFFSHLGMFWRDLTSYWFFFPVLFFAGIIFVCVYISILVGSFEEKSIMHSDRYDIAYRIVFTVTFFILTIRSFLGDFANPSEDFGSNLNVPIAIIALAMLSGIVTWLTPKIKDNDSNDF